MKTEKEMLDISDRVYRLLMDEKLTYMEVFAILETNKSYFVGRLIESNMKPEVLSVVLK